jgi:hypothetical protein
MIRIDVDLAHLFVVGLMWAGVVPFLVYNLRRTTKARKPLYLLSMPVALTMVYLYMGQYFDTVFGTSFLGPRAGIVVRVVLFLVSCLFYLEIFVDRLEAQARAELKQLIEAQGILNTERVDEQRSFMRGDQQKSRDYLARESKGHRKFFADERRDNLDFLADERHDEGREKNDPE